MSRQNRTIEELLPGKVRKRACSSPASTSSSVVQNYRFKRAIVVGKRGGSTTVPTWKFMGLRIPSSTFQAIESPKYAPSQACNGHVTVSARKLAATLWEMNGTHMENSNERKSKREARVRERASVRSARSGSFPLHLSDPSHSPVSERMDRSRIDGCRRRSTSVSDRLRITDSRVGISASVSNASLMEVENKSIRTNGVETRLKDVSSTLITCKELLKIINRMWSTDSRPSSSMHLISTLYTELERARLLINQIIGEQSSDHNDINYLLKLFAEEKAAWKSKEQEVVEAAIESLAGELEIERKFRRRAESLNKKLGKELAEAKASLLKAANNFEMEKQTRVVVEHVYDELGEEKFGVEEIKRNSKKEIGIFVDEKNTAIDKVRSQLEAFLGTKTAKGKQRRYLNRNEVTDDAGEVDDGMESDLHSIELSTYKNHNLEQEQTRRSVSSKGPRRSTYLQRAASDGIQWSNQNELVQSPKNTAKTIRHCEIDNVRGYKLANNRTMMAKERTLSGFKSRQGENEKTRRSQG